MKKIFFLLIAALMFSAAHAQTSVRVRSETVGFWTISADTMQILKTDQVINASIYNPASSTDSVTVTGCTFTVDGITTNGVKIPPGDVTVNLGFKYAFIDSLNIAIPGTAYVSLLIKRD